MYSGTVHIKILFGTGCGLWKVLFLNLDTGIILSDTVSVAYLL
jgi:hypothetical protein